MAAVPPSPRAAAAAAAEAGELGRSRRTLPFVGLTIAGALGLVGVVWGGFMLIGALSENHPDLTPALVAGTLSGLIVLAIFGMRAADAPPPPPKRRDDPEDGSGGGGSRRPEPAPRPHTPPPAPDEGPAAPWDEFDAVRSGWERVPAGHV